MKSIKFFFLCIIALTMTNTYADKIYRHVPLNVTLAPGDVLVVDYDFAGKKGIQCTSNSKPNWVEFSYKGFKKSAPLPVILQSARVPEQNKEELADVSGQFNILASNKAGVKSSMVSCDYL